MQLMSKDMQVVSMLRLLDSESVQALTMEGVTTLLVLMNLITSDLETHTDTLRFLWNPYD